VACIPPVPGDGEPFLGHTKKISESLWGPKNEFVYTASEDGTIRRWDVATQELNTMVQFNPQLDTEVTSMDYSRDKTLIIATGRDSTARVTCVDSYQKKKGRIFSIKFKHRLDWSIF
jgi:WD40 repeat protein